MYIEKEYSQYVLQGLNMLRQNGDLCDVELQVDGLSINAHKVVLAAISNYFKAMFTGFMKESITTTVSLQDIDSKSVSILVDFAYTGHINFTINNVQSLLVSANMLGVEKVVDACCDFLKIQLHSSNCLGFYEFADIHSLEDLKSTCFAYILDNFEDIIKYDEMLALQKSSLKKIISNVDLNITNEESVFHILEQWVFHSMNERINDFYDLFSELKLLQFSGQFLKSLKLHSLLLSPEGYQIQLKLNQVLNMKVNPYRLLDNDFVSHNQRRRSSGDLVVVGGREGLLDTLRTCCIYNHKNDKWKACTSLEDATVDSSAAAIHNKVYVTGGMCNQSGAEEQRVYVSSVVSYCPVTDSWSTETDMNVQRGSHVCVAHNGKLYVFGGYDGQSCLKSVECYDPKTKLWSNLPDMKFSRSSFAAVVLEDFIYVLGGQGTAHLCTVERYNIKKNTWNLMPSMSTKRINFGAAQVHGFIYVVGGHDGQDYLRSMERFDPILSEWTVVSPLPSARTGIGVAVLSNEIYVLGGHDGNRYLDSCYSYDPCEDRWRKACNMITPRCYMAVTDVWLPSQS